MAEKKIGAAYVEILTKGITKVQSDLDKIKTKLNDTGKASAGAGKEVGKLTDKAKAGVPVFEKLGTTLQNAAKTATVGFLAGAAAITGFIAAADPAGMNKLQGTMAAISVQIGSIFLPLLDQVNALLNKFLTILRGLSGEQKDQILRWVEIAGAVALGVVVLSKVVGVIRMASVAMTAFGVATGIATGGISTVLGVIAALLAGMGLLLVSTEEGRGVLSELAAAFAPLIDAMKEVGALLLGTLKTAFEQFKVVMVGVISQAIAVVVPLVKTALGVISALFGAVMPVVGTLVKVFGRVLQALAPIFMVVVRAVTQFYTVLYGIFTKIVKAVTPIIEAVMEIIEEFATLFEEVMRDIAPLIEEVVKVLSDVANAFMEAFGDAIVSVIRVALVVVRQVLDTIKSIVGAIRNVIDTAKTLKASVSNAAGAVSNAVRNPVATIRGAVGAVGNAIAHPIDTVKGIFGGMFGGGATRTAVAAPTPAPAPAAPQPFNGNFMSDIMKGVVSSTARVVAAAPGRHEGQALRKVEMSSFTDLWKKAMQSTNETPEQRRLAEISRNQERAEQEQQRQTRVQEEIRDRIGGAAVAGMGMMGY